MHCVAALGVDGGAEFLGGDRGGGEADDGAAGVLPRAGEDLHGGGLAGAGGRQSELHGAAAGGHLADQGLLGGVELELPLAAASAIAMPTRTALMVRPPVRRAAARMRCSASMTAREVYCRAPARL